MRIISAVVLALLPLALTGNAQAAVRGQFTVQTSRGEILVESFASSAGEPHPAVPILSGSKGFGSSAYDEIGRTFGVAGLDAYLVHVLSERDLAAIASAGSARARIGYYAQRQSDWIAAVRDVVSFLNTQPRHVGRVGVLGISLGAQIAAASAAGRTDVGALVLVDGGFPNGYPRPVRSMPPLQLIWGGADQTFPLPIGQDLLRMTQGLGGPASLDVYQGGAHDFFLKSGSQQAEAARRSAAAFLVARLSR